MRGQKTVDLGFEVNISRDGDLVPVSTVTVRAPGLGKLDVHSTMAAFWEDGIAGFQVKQTALLKASGIDIAKARKEYDDAVASGESLDGPSDASDDDHEIMDIMASGLGRDAFPHFTRYIQTALTGSKLAYVGDIGDGQKPQPITDEFWMELDRHEDGMDAAMRIMGAFTNFFGKSHQSQKESGKKKSTSSAKRTRASTQ